MSEIVKICKKGHGELRAEDCFIKTEKRYGPVPKKSFSCKACKAKSQSKYDKKEDVLKKKRAKNKLYKIKFPEKIKAYQKKYRAKNVKEKSRKEKERRYKDIETYRMYGKDKQKKWRDELHDNYIKNVITHSWNISTKEIPEWLIEVKRALIMLRREIKKRQENGA